VLIGWPDQGPAKLSETDFQSQGVVVMSKRDAYVAKMKHQLDELNAKMSDLEAKATVAKEDAREKYK